jgi:hypothetical protein
MSGIKVWRDVFLMIIQIGTHFSMHMHESCLVYMCSSKRWELAIVEPEICHDFVFSNAVCGIETALSLIYYLEYVETS